FTVLHAPILLGLYNGSTPARALVTGVIDGWMAHGKQGVDGAWSYPNEINWRSDAERVGDGGGVSTPLQASWAAWRFTGDAKYLRPIEARVAKSPAGLAEFNENAFTALPDGAALRSRAAKSEEPFGRYSAWSATGDLDVLATLHGEAIADKMQHMAMYTDGHWWSDRVEQPSDILQRERLGGIALKRNQTWPGNTVSWRFATPDAAEQVAILLPGATRDRFKVIAYNTSNRPQAATMTAWNVTAGRWSIAAERGATPERTTVALERSAAIPLTFAPGETVLDFALVTPTTPVETRPDLGIGRDDVAVAGQRVTVTVHSLGAVPTTAGRVSLWQQDRRIASAAVPPLAAPGDLIPKTAQVTLTVPTGIDPQQLLVRVEQADGGAEVTQQNNTVAIADRTP
ncbi:MAG: LamG domain-containing protein, partial [Sphingomonas sp.]|nr:LamG domain-containing protein [Sphingomonas sp.]